MSHNPPNIAGRRRHAQFPTILKESCGCITYRDKDGYRHREDGPALIFCNGEEEWYIHGVLHREDGPAYTDDLGNGRYFVNDVEIERDLYINHSIDEIKSMLEMISIIET